MSKSQMKKLAVQRGITRYDIDMYGNIFSDSKGAYVKYSGHLASRQKYTELLKEAEKVLTDVHYFIRNGIELGYIQMPDKDTPDPAKDIPDNVDNFRTKLQERLNDQD